ncbi:MULTISPECIES: PAAR domain-containing protein [unclassified Pseudomonas]|uniref:PAAR domain-containing protein n=1 Tax=unclassified Pseudomonas TaxID=196821 RepID=UPI000C884FB3|nr:MULTISPECIES: PAAR domain-containing protein [unclassified Pseudomonas]PMZ92602.1 PAAR domain-containing protein [Pseudomonas sp. FW215-T2]PNA16825.1 PAAR domain-containing protein [Pseudomonas sp. FW215-R3]PNB39728.1 PAAR domain-containing protein [Pseudomonas sp. FW305-131]
MRRYHITVGAKTTADGTVRTGWDCSTINGQAMAREGDEVDCPKCDSIGRIVCDGPRLVDLLEERNAALDGDLCKCKCDPPPRLIANQTLSCQEIEGGFAPRARATAQPAAAPPPNPSPVAPQQTGFSPTRTAPSPSFSELPGLVCQNLWRGYQQRAEAIVAPGGILIADPKARNRAINAAYARLWLEDQRFQWAGLAAFASKQVGCGLLHAAESVDKMQAEHEAVQRLKNSARKGFFGLFGQSERDRQTKLREFEQAQRDYELAGRNNPVPGSDLGRDGESLSYAQRTYQFVYEMLAMGNTTLFLDVFPLHAFYKERGLKALETCLPSRSDIYGHGQHPVLWPITQETLEFGIDHEQILQAFEAIEVGNIAESVVHLAWHEQQNILQPAMYSDRGLVWLLRSNHVSYITGIPSGAAEAIELTLASQCRPSADGRTIGFGSNPIADLSDIQQRMAFVLSAAAQFDELLRRSDRHLIEKAILDICAGRGVR